jgi:hypothetical protein
MAFSVADKGCLSVSSADESKVAFQVGSSETSEP